MRLVALAHAYGAISYGRIAVLSSLGGSLVGEQTMQLAPRGGFFFTKGGGGGGQLNGCGIHMDHINSCVQSSSKGRFY